MDSLSLLFNGLKHLSLIPVKQQPVERSVVVFEFDTNSKDADDGQEAKVGIEERGTRTQLFLQLYVIKNLEALDNCLVHVLKLADNLFPGLWTQLMPEMTASFGWFPDVIQLNCDTLSDIQWNSIQWRDNLIDLMNGAALLDVRHLLLFVGLSFASMIIPFGNNYLLLEQVEHRLAQGLGLNINDFELLKLSVVLKPSYEFIIRLHQLSEAGNALRKELFDKVTEMRRDPGTLGTFCRCLLSVVRDFKAHQDLVQVNDFASLSAASCSLSNPSGLSFSTMNSSRIYAKRPRLSSSSRKSKWLRK